MNFDEIRFQAADQIERLVRTSAASRGPMRAPDIDLSSPAHKNLTEDASIGCPEFPNPVANTLGHVERLIVAADDQMLCVANLLAKPEPSWFGHLSVIRSSVEALSRIWFLTDPAVTPIERSRRFVNERLYELQHASTMLAGQLAVLPEELKETTRVHLREQRASLSTWAKARELALPGGSIGETRPGPLDLLALIYTGSGDGVPDANVLGAWHYSTLSSAAHGLPEGMSQYVRPAVEGEHAHLMMTSEELARSLEPVLTVHEATTRRLAQFFRWPMSAELLVETAAARLFFNRAGGFIQ